MSIFSTTFPEYIKIELDRRKEFDYAQDYVSPFLRVTSLIEGSIQGSGQLFGFTLGIPDNIVSNQLNSIMNTSKNGCVVGLTYSEGDASEVRIKNVPTNIPTPGVTSVEINTLYRGGVVFDATVKFKFYTIEQYNFIYQTFFRPGTLVMVEFGHKFAKKNLEIPRLTRLEIKTRIDNYSKGIKPLVTANYNYIIGITTNFLVTPNQTGEYEAEIKLTNASDLAWQFNTKSSRIAFQNVDTSTSIYQLFGKQETVSLGPGKYSTDKVYNRIKHLAEDPNDRFIWKLSATTDPTSEKLSGILGTIKSFLRVGGGDYYWISLYDFIDNVYNKFILNEILGHLDTSPMPGEVVQIPMATKRQVELSSKLGTIRNSLMINVDPIKSTIPYYENLRTISPMDCFINNEKIYPNADFFKKRTKRYLTELSIGSVTKRAASSAKNLSQTPTGLVRRPVTQENIEADSTTVINSFFFSVPQDDQSGSFKKKFYYKKENEDSSFTSLRGIFVSYDTIRNSFLSATTLGTAFNNLLGKINSSTNGIFNLKLRRVELPDGSSELIIYDDNVKIPETFEDPYEFDILYKKADQPSAIVNVSMNFALSEAFAATLMVRSHQNNNTLYIGGDLRDVKLTEIATDPNIKSMIPPVESLRKEETLDSGIQKTNIDEKIYDVFDKYDMGGMIEFLPEEMTADIVSKERGDVDYKTFLNTLPSSPKVNLRFLGISNFRYGELFKINGILPTPYKDGMFFVIGHKHTITSEGWFTDMEAQFIGKSSINSMAVFSERDETVVPYNKTTYSFNTPSTANVDPKLMDVMNESQKRLAAEGTDVQIISGFRTPEENRKIGGALNSRHLYGKAVDVQVTGFTKAGAVAGDTNAKQMFAHVATVVQQVSKEKGVNVVWGGEWSDPYDPNHYHIDK